MANYISVKEAANRWRLASRTVTGFCHDGKILGAIKEGRDWKIPASASKPFDKRFRKKLQNNQHFLPLPVGVSDFVKVSSKYYYIDKTMLLKEIIDDALPVTLFTRPRRFGKTLNMDMIRTFFEISDENTADYFKNMKIWTQGEYYQSFQGKYPVIYISLKDVKCTSFSETYDLLYHIISDEYSRHKELLTSSTIDDDDKLFFNTIVNGNANKTDLTLSLFKLSKMLHTHYKQCCVVIVDEYDTSIQAGYSYNFYDDIILFMRGFLSGCFKDNQHLAFGFLTGVLRVARESIFSGLNNLVVSSLIDNKYNQYFGFTKDEVTEMAQYYGKTEKLAEIEEWYDGYRFGNIEIYNPWSVTNYFYNNCLPKPYWTNTSDNAIIKEVATSLKADIIKNLYSLLNKETIQANLNMNVIYPCIKDDADTIFSFLLIAGYLKPVSEPTETEYGTFVTLAIPNKEILRVYNVEILSLLKQNSDASVISTIEKALLNNDGNTLSKAIEKYMINCVSFFDTTNENFYHGMMLGLLASLSSKYYLHSNRETGLGRFDLVLEPKIANLPCIIMEFKAEKDTDKLVSSANKALAQIIEKHYDTELKEKGITSITKYGIAFCGKLVEIVTCL